jgi:AcrR family transcriptional regulator
MNKIAESCGVSKATLYHYYKDKEGLLFDVIRFHLKELLEVVEEANRSEQSIAALRSSFLRRLGKIQTFFQLGKQEDKRLTLLTRQ